MNRRDLFKAGGCLLAGAVCGRLARLLPSAEAKVPYVVGERGPELFRPRIAERFQAAAIYGKPQGTLIHIKANSYIPKDYIARVERAMRQSGDGIDNVTRSLGKFEKKLGEAKTGKRST